MYHSVEKFCHECAVCQANKSSTKKPGGLLQPVENPDVPFSHITMDFVTNLPVSDRGYDCIFTVVDRFSRLVRFIPCHTAIDAVQCANLFFENWVNKFGMPSKIISDRDVKFQSKFWQHLCSLLDCRVAMSTSYHPQTDGLSERYHRSVEQILRCYCSGQQEKWCTLIGQCEFAFNSTHQVAIDDVPFRVIYGFVPRLPIDVSLSHFHLPAVEDFVSAHQSV